MADVIFILIAIATVLAAGATALRLLAREVEMPLFERWSLSWILGGTILPALVWVVGSILGAGLLRVAVPLAALVCWLLALRVKVTSGPRVRPGVLGGILCVVILVQAVLVAKWTVGTPLGWDALLIWHTKARLIFDGHGAMPMAYFTDAGRTWSHPHYPMGFSALEAWLHLSLGRIDESWVRILGPLYWLSAMGIVAGATVRTGGTAAAGLAGAAALFFVPYVFGGTWNALAGYADFPIGTIFLAAVSWLPREQDAGGARLCGALAAAGMWTKMEGRYLWLSVVLLATGLLLEQVLRKRASWRGGEKMLVAITLPGGCVLAVWSLFVSRMGVASDLQHYSPTPAHIAANLWKLPDVIARIGQELAQWEFWSFLWPGAALAVVALAIRGAWRKAVVMGGALGMVLGVDVVVYCLSTWPDVAHHMELSISRLILQLVPTAILAIALAIPQLPPKANA